MSWLYNITYFIDSSTNALWALWMIMFFIFIIASLIFSYQWRHYGVQNSNLRFGEFVYYIMAILGFSFSALCIILFNANL